MTRNQFSGYKNFIFKLYHNIPYSIKKPLVRLVNNSRLKRVYRSHSPSTLIFYVTNRCNARCKHCFYWRQLNNKDSELGLEKIKKVALSLKKPLDLLVITGGEPFLRKDIVEICNIFYKYNDTRRISIDTNGILSDTVYNKVKSVIAHNPSKELSVFISLDGVNETHDIIRGCKGAFSSVESTLKKLKPLELRNRNLVLMVATTLTKDNLGEIGDVISFVKKFNVLHKFNIIRNNSTIFNIDNKMLNSFDPKERYDMSFDDLEKFYKVISSRKDLGSRIETMKIRHSIDMLKNKKMVVKCLAVYNNAVLFPNGDVSICEPTKPFANLAEFDYDLYTLLNSEKALEQKNKLKCCFCLQPCNLLDGMKYDLNTLVRL